MQATIQIKAKDSNEFCLKVLAWILIIPVIVIILNLLVSDSTVVTAAVYAITLIVVLIRGRLYTKDLGIMLSLYLPFAVSYLLFEPTRLYYQNAAMLIILIFFLPCCAFVVSHIKDWKNFFLHMAHYGLWAVGLGMVLLLFLDYSGSISYMDFSYAMLPSICALYYCGRFGDGRKKRLFFLTTGVGVIEIIILGARMPIFLAVAFMFFIELFNNREKLGFSKKLLILMAVLVIVAVVVLLKDSFLQWLSGISWFEDSYFVQRLLKGTLFESSTRESVAEYCIRRIQTMGMAVSGFFGDRAYTLGHSHPHNIFYELLMGWGWVLGGIACLGFAILLINRIFEKDNTKRVVAAFMIFSILGRFVVSGTYVVEGKFWIALIALICLERSSKSVGMVRRK